MKKYINISLAVILSLCVTGLFYSFITIKKSPHKNISISSEDTGVKFGRGPDCTGPRGMCSLQDDSSESKLEGFDAKASFFLDGEGRLIMEIIKTSITEADMEVQFTEEFFEFDKNVLLPNKIIEQIGLEGNERNGFLIQEGQYRIIEKEESYNIVILE